MQEIPGWPEKEIALFLDAHCCHVFGEAGSNEAGKFLRVRAAFMLAIQFSDQTSHILSATIWSLAPDFVLFSQRSREKSVVV